MALEINPEVINLTSLSEPNVRDQLDLACRRHGCFHITHPSFRRATIDELKHAIHEQTKNTSLHQTLVRRYHEFCQPISYDVLASIYTNLCLPSDLIEGRYSPGQSRSIGNDAALTLLMQDGALAVTCGNDDYVIKEPREALTVMLGSVGHPRYRRIEKYLGRYLVFELMENLERTSPPRALQDSLLSQT